MSDLNTPIKPGEYFSASLWNALRKIAARVSNIRTTAGLTMQSGPGGITLGLDNPGTTWAKILSGSNPYVWREQLPKPGGGWTDGTGTGTSATEVNNNASVPAGKIVRLDLSRGPKAATFIYSACS